MGVALIASIEHNNRRVRARVGPGRMRTTRTAFPGRRPEGSMPKTPTISFVSLGCSKNLVDSERMLGLLAQDGYALVPDSQPADLVIINTCGFIDAARQESIGVIEEMLERKRSGAGQGGDRRRLPGRAPERDLARAVPRGRPRRRRLRPRRDRSRGRPAPGRPERAARVVPAGAGPGPGRPRAAADHAPPPGLPQGLGRVRPVLYVLRDPAHARQARDQADRDGRGRGRGAGRATASAS